MASRKVLASKVYQRFLQICEQWPVDSSRVGRDLGAHIKENFGSRMKNSKMDVQEAEKVLDSLVKISSNYYREKYPRKKETAFTGDAMKKGGFILSTEYQNKMRDKRGFWSRLTTKKRVDKKE